MKAAIRRAYCSPNQIRIESLDKPILEENEILIKVHATTVNRTDCANLTAKPFIMRFFLGLLKPKQIVLGTDYSGEIVAIGEKVKSYEIGDHVFGFNDAGMASQAEYLTTTGENVFAMPLWIDFNQAAASLEGAHYAYTFVHKVNIQPGQRILINGATGAIGSALLQFVRQYDVHLVATCDTKNIDLIRSLGADKIYDYTTEDFAASSDTYDFIFDAVGKSTFGKCKPLLKQNGIYISSELGPYAQNVFYPMFNSFRSKKVIFPIPYDTKVTIPYIIGHLEKGNFKPVIDSEYKLGEIAEAYAYVIQGKKTGNVIIDLQ